MKKEFKKKKVKKKQLPDGFKKLDIFLEFAEDLNLSKFVFILQFYLLFLYAEFSFFMMKISR